MATSPDRWEPRGATELIMWSHPDGMPADAGPFKDGRLENNGRRPHFSYH